MRVSQVKKNWLILLCSFVITLPVVAQEKDTANQTQTRQIQPASPAKPGSAAAVNYPPAVQYPPAQQNVPKVNPAQVQQAVRVQSDYFTGLLDGGQAGKFAAVGEGWFCLGCFGGVIGVLIPFILEPNVVSIEGLMGKSNEYIAGYNEGYKKEIKGRRVKKAFTGCIITGVTEVVFYVLMFSLSISSGY